MAHEQAVMSSQESFGDSRSPTLNLSQQSSLSDLNNEEKGVLPFKTERVLRFQTDSDEFDEDDSTIPPPKSFAWIKYVALSCYRRLFTLVFLGNLAAFIYIMIKDNKLLNIVNASVANLLALGLARQPLVVNMLFLIFGSIPRTAPLVLRRMCAKIYCYGGVHSGCGVASFLWYLGFIGLLTKQYVDQDKASAIQLTPATIILSYIILALNVAIIIAAYPKIRFKIHDYFELTHRFCSWAIIVLFWPLMFVFSISIAHSNGQRLGQFLSTFPTFWMVILSTLATIHPWLYLRRVSIQAEPLSTHAIRLHFDYTSINFGQGLSLSKHPLKDWHSFATFPDVPSAPGTNGTTEENPNFSCLVSKAGDWTQHTILNPPTHLWKRSIPIYGFGYVMKNFNKVLLVTTGSGIGPCLSFLGDPNRPTMRILWQTRDPFVTYKQPVVDLVQKLDPNPVIMSSTVNGQRRIMLPRVMKMIADFEPEAVCVISNPKLTNQLVYELESRGIHAYGPIFDS